jgi:hypothetical protein
MNRDAPDTLIEDLMHSGGRSWTEVELARETGLPLAEVQSAVARLVAAGRALSTGEAFAGRCGETAASIPEKADIIKTLEDVRETVIAQVNEFLMGHITLEELNTTERETDKILAETESKVKELIERKQKEIREGGGSRPAEQSVHRVVPAEGQHG